MALSDQAKEHIRLNHRRYSVRRLARDLHCPRNEVQHYIASLREPASSGPARLVSKSPSAFLIGVLLLLTFASYANTLGYEFVWDDRIQVLENPLLEDRGLSGAAELFRAPVGETGESFSYRPIQNLSYYLQVLFFGPDPRAFHAGNILFQALAAILLFGVLLGVTRDRETAFWPAALFAVHPVQIAVVGYVAGRADSLATIGMLLSFYLFHRGLTRTRAVSGLLMAFLSGLAYLAALFTKELAAVLPLLMIAYFLIFRRGHAFRFAGFHFVGYAIALSVYLAVRVAVLGEWGQGGLGDLPYEVRVAGSLIVIPIYLRLLLVPYGLHMAYQFPRPQMTDPGVVWGFLVLCLLLILTWRSRKNPALCFGWSWFWIFLFPVVNPFVLLNAPMAEHWLYNACGGFFVVLWLGAAGLSSRVFVLRRLLEPLAAFAVTALAVTTFHSNGVWKNEITLFENTLKYAHHDPYIHNNLGTAYVREKDLRRAEIHFRKALEIDPQFENAIRNLRTLERQKRATPGGLSDAV